MKIQSFSLKNIGQFQDISVSLAPTKDYSSNVTVFIGNNGSGKTSLLKSATTALTWFVARLKHEKSNGANSALIEVIVKATNIQNRDLTYNWRITKSRTARKAEFTTSLIELNQLTDYYKHRLAEDETTSLPLIAFYPVERSVIDIPLKIREKHQFLQIDGYDNALNNAVDFRRFFEWFREREDVENERIKDIILFLKQDHTDELFSKKIEEYNSDSFKDIQLEAVRQAIYAFMPDFKNLQVTRKPRLAMVIDKNGKQLNVSQLSQGEKSLMALVGDIARRLAMMNPKLDNPLHGQGIVLIDEIDMHLHPQWQRTIIHRLQTTFPNCQFILTTHSPLVISDVQDILVYDLEDQKITALPSLYGQDANTVLLQYMDTSYRNPVVTEQITQAMDAIQNNNLDKAQLLINDLRSTVGENQLDVMRLIAMLKKRSLVFKQGQ